MDEVFRMVHIFAGINDSGLDLLKGQAESRTVPPAEVIVREGDPGNRFYVIGSGVVRVVKHFGRPEEVLLATLKEGNFFGEMCIFEAQPRSATVATVTETTLYSLPATAFYRFHKKMPDQYSILVVNIARDISRRLRYLDEVFAARH